MSAFKWLKKICLVRSECLIQFYLESEKGQIFVSYWSVSVTWALVTFDGNDQLIENGIIIICLSFRKNLLFFNIIWQSLVFSKKKVEVYKKKPSAIETN